MPPGQLYLQFAECLNLLTGPKQKFKPSHKFPQNQPKMLSEIPNSPQRTVSTLNIPPTLKSPHNYNFHQNPPSQGRIAQEDKYQKTSKTRIQRNTCANQASPLSLFPCRSTRVKDFCRINALRGTTFAECFPRSVSSRRALGSLRPGGSAEEE